MFTLLLQTDQPSNQELLPTLLEIVLLLTALFITRERSIQLVIRVYQVQCLLIALVTALTVWFVSGTLLALFVAALPVMLCLLIEPLLAWATTQETRAPIGRLLIRREERRNVVRNARFVWLQRRPLTSNHSQRLLIFLLFLLLSFLISSRIFGPQSQSERIGLLVALVLCLNGLYNTMIKRDTITQVIGLLMMDHGLYLAIIEVIHLQELIALLVTGIYCYTLITLFILANLLPQVRRSVGSISLDSMSDHSKLRG